MQGQTRYPHNHDPLILCMRGKRRYPSGLLMNATSRTLIVGGKCGMVGSILWFLGSSCIVSAFPLVPTFFINTSPTDSGNLWRILAWIFLGRCYTKEP